MEPAPNVGNSVEFNTNGTVPPASSFRPWWRGPSSGGVSLATIPENASKPPAELSHDEAGSGSSKQHECVVRKGETTKEMQSMDGKFSQEKQQMQHVYVALPALMPEYRLPRTQLELSQPAVCAAYSFSHLYTGMMTAYTSQAMVHSHLLTMSQPRVPLPQEMAEEPVYVNAKQYHGILRRRQSRAKAELDKNVKTRKPYLHESRHLHAMRRPRGCGGRFLNTKNNNANTASIDSANGAASAATSSSSEALLSASSAKPHLTNTMTEETMPAMHDFLEPHKYSSRNVGYKHHSRFQISPFYPNRGVRNNILACSTARRGAAFFVNQLRNNALAI